MSIITIAREHGAWTAETSRKLADKLNAALLTKDELEKRLLDAGMKAKLFQRYDERKPGFFSAFSPDQDIYLLYLKTIMLQAAAAGNVVVLGRGAHLLLGDLPNCLRIRLVAPTEIRLNRLQKEYGWDEETANRMIHKCDADRAGFCNFHFNEEWSNAALYDLTINTEKLSDEKLVNGIAAQIAARISDEDEKEAAKLIKNRLLAQQVATALLVEQKISLAFLEVNADDDGRITLLGATNTPAATRLAEETAARIPGVTAVDNKIRVAFEIAQNAPHRS